MLSRYRTQRKQARRTPVDRFERLEGRTLWAAHIAGDPSVYATIQAAVDAALPGSTIDVDPGNYNEYVIVNKPLNLRGARAGTDARNNTRGVNETVIVGAPDPSSPNTISCIYVNANGVTVDGFVVQGNSSNGALGAGIVLAPNTHGSTVVNNILQHNVAGLYLANNSSTKQTLIKNNVFFNNNLDGDHSGRGIYTNGGFSGGNLTNVTIDGNAFIKNTGSPNTTTTLEAAIALQTLAANAQSNIRITNNMFDGNGKAMLFFNSKDVLIEGNLITWATDLWSAALRFEGGNSDITIRGNTMFANPGNVVRIDNKVSSGTNFDFSITGNNIYMNGLNTTTKASIVVDGGQYSGSLDATNNWWGQPSGPLSTQIIANGHNIITSGHATAPFAFPSGISYLGRPWSTEGKIEVENFDHGGQGITFSDVETSNLGQGKVRQPWGVDLQATTDAGGGWNLGYTKTGEWLQYTIDIEQAGTYFLDVRVAGTSSVGKFHFELDGVNITGPISMLNTGGSQKWNTITRSGIQLPAGQHILRLVMDPTTGSIGNFNWFQFRNANPIPPPSAPTNLNTSATSSTSVTLSWSDNSNNETGFMVERKGPDGLWQLIHITPPNVAGHIDNTVSAATGYTYRVRAVNGSGESASTNESFVNTPVNQIVTYVSDMAWVSSFSGFGPVERDMNIGSSAAGDGTIITLNGVTYTKGIGTHAISEVVLNLGGKYNKFLSDIGIDDRQSANGSAVFSVWADGVKIYDSGVMGALSATKSIDVSVAGVQQLKLRVDNGGDNTQYDHADWANARLLKDEPQLPAQPSGVVATPVSQTQINLTWNDVANETGYRIERSIDGINFASIGGTLAANSTSYNDTTVSGSGTYYYRVVAINLEGESPASAVVSAAPLQPPAQPMLTAQPFSNVRIDLTWTNVANETGYRIERKLNGNNWAELGTVGADVTSFSDNTAQPSTTYTYRVVAVNAVGESTSPTATATTPAAPTAPAAPSNLVVTLINHGQIDLTWQDNSNNETGWIIERSTDGVNFGLFQVFNTPNVTSFSDTTPLALNTTYLYRVRATNGVGDSANSNVASATTPATSPPPAAPGNLVATPQSSVRIDLAWADNSGNETGFIIERSIDGVNFTAINTIGANQTAYVDTFQLTADTKYYYRVAAMNSGGTSGYTLVASATTGPLTGLPAGWASGDIGNVGLPGNAAYTSPTYTLQGAGTDIYGNSDGFHYAYQQLTGDGTIIVRVASLQNTDANAKAGIMFRDTLAANSKHVSLAVTPSNGIKFLRRSNNGGSTSSTTQSTVKAPYWLKLVRAGNTFTAYTSTNGTTWTTIGSQSITMNSTIYVGMVVCSRKTATLATATFDNVSVS